LPAAKKCLNYLLKRLIMNKFFLSLILLCFAAGQISTAQDSSRQETTKVAHFEKLIISPHIEATITEGDDESVTLLSSTVSADKIHIESKNNVLRVYLEGAKEWTKNEMNAKKNRDDDGESRNGTNKKPLYTGTVLKVAISYKTLQELSVRGDERLEFKSKLDQDEFTLTLYGTLQATIPGVELRKMHTTMYGTCNLVIKSGNITEQIFTTYGTSTANTLAVNNKITRSMCYGESQLKVNVSDLLKVSAFGEAQVGYKGSPVVKKGIAIGQVKIYQIK
jgi:hypothetical protein